MAELTFEDLLNPPLARWPARGDRLLAESIDWNDGVSFPNNEWLRHVYIWDGYMKAADRLIVASAGDRLEQETMLFPILANYRHAVELGLKWLLVRYGPTLGVDEQAIEDAKHDLWRLWQLIRPIIQTGNPEEDASVAAVELVVKDLHDLDPSAMSLRYWVNKNGEAFALPEGRYDLERTRDVMKGVANFLDGVDGWLDALASAQP